MSGERLCALRALSYLRLSALRYAAATELRFYARTCNSWRAPSAFTISAMLHAETTKASKEATCSWGAMAISSCAWTIWSG